MAHWNDFSDYGSEENRKTFVERQLARLNSTEAEDPAIAARKKRQTDRHLAWLDQRDGIGGFGGALVRVSAGDGGQRDD